MKEKIRIIPAIDLINGKCVRLEKGQYESKKTYNENPLEVAKQFENHGVKYLHLVDLDGAKAKHIVNWKVLEQIAGKTNLTIDFGGGLNTKEDLKIAFESGANQVTAGSKAVKDKEEVLQWIKTYGSKMFILGADVIDKKIAINAWQTQTDISIFDFIADYKQQGLNRIICTDVEKDGMLAGVSMDLYLKILAKFQDIELIASGGVSSIQDIEKLSEAGIFGAIIGKAIYENKINLKDLEKYVD